MIEQLFGSKTRVKLLGLFYQNPNRSFYVREITRKIDEQINSVRRELANLLSIGIIKSDNSNNKLYYEVNQEFEYFDALSNMFNGKAMPTKKNAKKQTDKEIESPEVQQTAVEESFTDEHIHNIVRSGNVRALLYTGQFTRDDSVSVDIIIIGDMNIPNLENAISKLEDSEKKQIRYSVFTPSEFYYRRQINDRFLANVLLAKKIVHIDKENYLQ
jgi:predicted transcriptional regulator